MSPVSSGPEELGFLETTASLTIFVLTVRARDPVPAVGLSGEWTRIIGSGVLAALDV
jgi:hypothetical protein